ncbi:MAG: ribonuclease T2 family protein [Pseudolabrys sp.]
MGHRRFLHRFRVFGIALAVGLALTAPGGAQDRRQGEPGKFDYYVLSLSWSPSYCEASAERAPNRAPDQQCGGRPFAFVVHGLWPQYERGFPSFCQVPAPRLDRETVGSVLDLMPSPRLVFHEWDRHGTCSGLTPHAYFETVRKARAVVKIPDDYLALAEPKTVSAADVADAFVKANPTLSRDDFAIVCDKKRLSEIRVCLTKAFAFRACPEVTQRACKLDRMMMPAVRGG